MLHDLEVSLEKTIQLLPLCLGTLTVGGSHVLLRLPCELYTELVKEHTPGAPAAPAPSCLSLPFSHVNEEALEVTQALGTF